MLLQTITIASETYYDTAWSFVYNGGNRANDNRPIEDIFSDVILASDGNHYVTGDRKSVV